MSNTKHIGQVVKFAETGFNTYKGLLGSRLLPAINDFIQAYKNLEEGELTQEVFEEATQRGVAGIVEKYLKKVEDEIEKLQEDMPVLRHVVLKQRPPFADILIDKWTIVQDAFNYISQQQYYGQDGHYNYPTNWAHIHIEAGKPKYDEAEIKKEFQEVISTEAQSKGLEMLQNIEKACNDFNNYLVELGAPYKITRPNDFFTVGVEGQFKTNPDLLFRTWFVNAKRETINA